MSRFWSPVVHTLTPYVPGEQPKLPGLVKLNTNENPYGPSPGVLAALAAETTDALRLYPDPDAGRLKRAISDYYEVTPAEVFVGNGSDEVLAHAFQALLRHGAPVLFPDVTYSFYPAYCRLYEIEHQAVPLTAALEVRVEDYDRECGGIVLPNPNAPTGRALPRAGIAALLDRHPGRVVVVDEAYVDFGAESAVPLVSRHPNLLVVQTLSKSRSLAGLRVGFAIGHPTLIEALGRVKDSFNSYPLGRLAIAGAVAALEDEAHFQHTRRRIMGSRDRLSGRLRDLGFIVLPSAANFVFASHPSWDGAQLTAGLRERSILVRHFPNPARIAGYLRISVGTERECDLLVLALSELLGCKVAAVTRA